MTLQQQIEAFLTGAPHAVAGASRDREKYGNKVLRAYQQRGRAVFPVNPSVDAVEGLPAFPDLASLPQTVHGLSVVTPPRVTEQVVAQAARLGIRHLWMQPGSESDRAVELAQQAGMNVIWGGPCILVALRFHEEEPRKEVTGEAAGKLGRDAGSSTFQRAQQHHRAGQLQEAAELYQEVLRREPERADAWHLLGMVAYQAADYQVATDCLGRAVVLQPDAATFHSHLGLAFRARHQLDQAVACYHRALELQPEAFETHNSLGVAWWESGSLDAAAASYRRALELQPDFADAHNNLGIVLKEQGRLEEAAANYRRALEIRPDYADALNNLGTVLRMQGQTEAAATCCQRAVELRPGLAEAHRNLGLVRQDQGDFAAAAACFRNALELRPHHAETQGNLGDVLHAQGRLDEAVASYRQALALAPNTAETHNDLGVALVAQGRQAEAVACYRRAVELRPDYADAHSNLGAALQELGEIADAVTCQRRAVALQPDSAIAFNNLANALQQHNELEAALACYRRALELKPDFAEVRHNLAQALVRLGRVHAAAAIWQQWLGQEPENPVAQHMVAALTGHGVPSRASDDYVRRTFDTFARTFDQQLERLEYHAPELVAAAVSAVCGTPAANLEVLDAGCGTGLCGPLLRPFARRLSGVDLSSGMVDKARARQVYDQLLVAELTAHLEASCSAYDVVASADTLCYFGDLQQVLAATARALRPGGALVFTVEQAGPTIAEQPGFYLQHHGRYCHTAAYVRATLAAVGFLPRDITSVVLRTERDQPVRGLLVSAGRCVTTDAIKTL